MRSEHPDRVAERQRVADEERALREERLERDARNTPEPIADGYEIEMVGMREGVRARQVIKGASAVFVTGFLQMTAANIAAGHAVLVSLSVEQRGSALRHPRIGMVAPADG